MALIDNELIRNHAAFIRSVADLLRGDYRQPKYGRSSWWRGVPAHGS